LNFHTSATVMVCLFMFAEHHEHLPSQNECAKLYMRVFSHSAVLVVRLGHQHCDGYHSSQSPVGSNSVVCSVYSHHLQPQNEICCLSANRTRANPVVHGGKAGPFRGITCVACGKVCPASAAICSCGEPTFQDGNIVEEDLYDDTPRVAKVLFFATIFADIDWHNSGHVRARVVRLGRGLRMCKVQPEGLMFACYSA
jgi:hypothetical protein